MNAKSYLLIILLGAVLFIPFLGRVHLFDWDEINFAESAREMLLTGNYSQVKVNFKPFWEKPPLFIWLQSISMSVFGVNEFAARFPNAIAGIITLLIIFNIGTRKADSRLGWIWVLVYIGSFLPHFYFKSGIIDPLFNLFIYLSIYQFAKLTELKNYKESKNFKTSLLAGLFCGLAILTKGPVALLMVLVTLMFFWFTVRFKPFLRLKYLLVFFVTAGIVSFAWFGLETIKNGPWFIVTFMEYQVRLLTTEDAGHGQPFYYHFLVLLIGCFPASIFIINAFKNEVSDSYEKRHFKQWNILLLLAVLIIFSIVKTKIVHYSSLAWFPLTYLSAYYIWKLLYLPQKRPSALTYTLLIILGIFLSAVFMAVPIIGSNIQIIEPYINDVFAKANLQAKVSWSYFEILIGVLFLTVVIVSIAMLRNKHSRRYGIITLFVGSALSLQLVMYFFVPKIERYSQGAGIDFFISKQQEKCFVDVLGYKSFAHLFYTQKQPPLDSTLLEKDTLLTRKILPAPAYFVTKIQTANKYLSDYNLEKIGEQNGFVFLKRK